MSKSHVMYGTASKTLLFLSSSLSTTLLLFLNKIDAMLANNITCIKGNCLRHPGIRYKEKNIHG